VPVPGFGDKGIVDLKLDDDQVMDLVTGDIGYHAAPVVANDVVIVGAAHTQGNTRRACGTRRATFAASTCERESALDLSHHPESRRIRQRDLAARFMVVHGTPASGRRSAWTRSLAWSISRSRRRPTMLRGHRQGDGLFGESLVAVDLKTGKRKWHYQFIHHGVWDYDIPCAPILADHGERRKIKAVAQPTKQAWVYVFDRVTGQPVWPIEERPVPQSDAPGEKSAATQPFRPGRPPSIVKASR